MLPDRNKLSKPQSVLHTSFSPSLFFKSGLFVKKKKTWDRVNNIILLSLQKPLLNIQCKYSETCIKWTKLGNAVQDVHLIQVSIDNVIWGVKCHSNKQWKRFRILPETMTIYICMNFFIKEDQYSTINIDGNSNLKI